MLIVYGRGERVTILGHLYFESSVANRSGVKARLLQCIDFPDYLWRLYYN
jgi:hypothetical protein